MFHLYRTAARLFFAAAAMGLFLFATTATVNASSASMLGSTSVFSHLLRSSSHTSYQFQTLNDNADTTFNQLLGINSSGVIAGYFGSGTVVNGTLHPNKGYTLFRPYNQESYVDENFPGSIQTQVTAINDFSSTAGFWVDSAGNNFDFVNLRGTFASYQDPNTGTFNGVQVNQLLGLNGLGMAVGFYTDSDGNDHGYKLDLNQNKFIEIPTASIPGAVSVVATGINSRGDVVGTDADANGTTHGFLIRKNIVHVFDYTGVANVSSITFLGVNAYDQVVGTYNVGTGDATQTHGFLLSTPLQSAQWQTIDAPNGAGTTTINGLNNNADLVGFYVDSNGNTDGFLARKS